MTFENVYLDFGTKMPKMPVFAQNEAPLNSPEPPHMGGLPQTLAPPYGGGGKTSMGGLKKKSARLRREKAYFSLRKVSPPVSPPHPS